MTLNTTSNNYSNHEQWVLDMLLATAIGRLKSRIISPSICRMLFDGKSEKRQPGEIIYVKERGTATTRTKTKAADYSFDAPDGDTNAFGTLVNKYVGWQIEESLVDIMDIGIDEFVNEYINDFIDQLAAQIDTDIFATYASMTTSSADTSLDDDRVLAIKQIADNTKWTNMPGDRVLVMPPYIENNDILNITTNPQFNKADNIGNERAAQAIALGSVGTVRGFDVYPTPQATTTAGSPTVYQCIAMQKNAIGMVSVPQTLNCGPQVIARRMNYQGMSFRFRYWTNPEAGKHKYTIEILSAAGIFDNRLCVSVPISK